MSAIMCEWFARCERPADGVIAHPVLGDVPCCERCADLVGAVDRLRRFGADVAGWVGHRTGDTFAWKCTTCQAISHLDYATRNEAAGALRRHVDVHELAPEATR